MVQVLRVTTWVCVEVSWSRRICIPWTRPAATTAKMPDNPNSSATMYTKNGVITLIGRSTATAFIAFFLKGLPQ